MYYPHYDDYALERTSYNINLLPAFWLMGSYAYYVESMPILSDAAFDAIAKSLSLNFSLIRHPHKWLIDRHRTNTGFYLSQFDYPSIIPHAIRSLKDVRSLERHKRVSRKV